MYLTTLEKRFIFELRNFFFQLSLPVTIQKHKEYRQSQKFSHNKLKLMKLLVSDRLYKSRHWALICNGKIIHMLGCF